MLWNIPQWGKKHQESSYVGMNMCAHTHTQTPGETHMCTGQARPHPWARPPAQPSLPSSQTCIFSIFPHVSEQSRGHDLLARVCPGR